MFFMKSEPSVSKFKLSLKREDIIKDIQSINKDENLKQQLYVCLEEKPQHDNKLNKITDFLNYSLTLEESTGNLQSQLESVIKVEQKVKCEVNKLRENCSVYALEHNLEV